MSMEDPISRQQHGKAHQAKEAIPYSQREGGTRLTSRRQQNLALQAELGRQPSLLVSEQVQEQVQLAQGHGCQADGP